jgi:hypothetical protein
MRNVPSDKYSVAWFKLAECVSRGEKERALGVYRLLSHSLTDQAFARQLHGDILLSFNDTVAAIEHYRMAAHLYKNDNRILEAAAVNEHLVTLAPEQSAYRSTLVVLYTQLNMHAKALIHATILCERLITEGELEEAARIVTSFEVLLLPEDGIQLREKLVYALIRKDSISSHIITPHITTILQYFMIKNSSHDLQRFLQMLEAYNESYYMHARAYVSAQSTLL